MTSMMRSESDRQRSPRCQQLHVAVHNSGADPEQDYLQKNAELEATIERMKRYKAVNIENRAELQAAQARVIAGAAGATQCIDTARCCVFLGQQGQVNAVIMLDITRVWDSGGKSMH